jgi:hypothetical protein
LYSRKRTNISLSKKYWSTWMFVISFHRTPGFHIQTVWERKIFQGMHIHIYQGLPIYKRVTKVSAMM